MKGTTVAKNAVPVAPKPKDEALGISWNKVSAGKLQMDDSSFGVAMIKRDGRKNYSISLDGFSHNSADRGLLSAAFSYSAIYSNQSRFSLQFGVSTMGDIRSIPLFGIGIEMNTRIPLFDHVALVTSGSLVKLTNGDFLPIAKLGIEMFATK